MPGPPMNLWGDEHRAYKDAVFISPHKFIGGPRTPGVLVVRRALSRNRCRACPAAARSTYVNTRAHATSPTRGSRRGRNAGDRQVDPRRPRVPAQGGRRRRGDPRARGRLHRSGDRAWSANPNIEILGNKSAGGCRSCRSSSATAGRLPAPQLRRRGAQRPVRDPVARRLLVRGPLRAPACSGSTSRQQGVRARDRARLRGHQAGLGPGQLQLLHQRGGVPVHPRRGESRRARGLAAPARLRVRPRDRPVAPPGRAPGAAAQPPRHLRTPTGGWPTRRTATASPSRALRGISPRRASGSRRPPVPLAARRRTGRPSARTSRTCAGSCSRGRVEAAAVPRAPVVGGGLRTMPA